MFLEHFGMDRHPFCENPPTDWLLNDDRFQQAMAKLQIFEQQANIALVTGQTGVGKSSLLTLFKQTMPKNRYRTIYFNLTSMSNNAFLRLIVTQLGESPKLGKDRLFLQILDRIEKSENQTVLIFDEAHLICSKSLTDLRLLSCNRPDSPVSTKIILCGQNLLVDTLKRSVLLDLSHRIWIRCRLNSLSKAQTLSYIDHRLSCAKAPEKIFTSDAKNIIHDYAGGIPRQLNNIATACLIGAAAGNFLKIDANFVNEVMADFSLA